MRAKRILWFFVLLCITLNIFGIFVFAEDSTGTEYKTTYLEDIIDMSSPVRDLEIMFNKTTSEILEMYPKDSAFLDSSQIIEAYELGYGTEDYSFYIYVYSPSGSPADKCSFNFYSEGEYVEFTTEKISSEHTLSKFKVNLDVSFKPYMRDPERNYYIRGVEIDGVCNDNALHHFRFSSYCLEREPISFGYLVGETWLDPRVKFKEGQKLIFSYAEKGFEIFEFDFPSKENYSFVKIDDTSFEVTLLTDIDSIKLPMFFGFSNYPLNNSLKNEYISFNVIDSEREENYKILFKLVGTAGSDEYTASTLGLRETNESSEELEKALYYKSSSKNVQKISCGYTGYRLNSSSSGEGFYDTLTSVYFSLPKDMLEMDDLVTYNDRYISSMDYTYNYGWLYPSIVVSTKDNPNAAEDLSGYINKAVKEHKYIGSKVFTDAYTEPDVGFTTWYFSSYLCFGVPSSYNSFDSFSKVSYTLLEGGMSSGDFGILFTTNKELGAFEYLVSGKKILESVEKLENEGYQKVSDLTHSDGTLSFKKTWDLLSYNECSFETLVQERGLFSAWWEKTFGSGFEVQESIKDIPAFVILDSYDISKALLMSDKEFSDTYLVNSLDVAAIKKEMKISLAANKVFVFSRFDTYRYFADELYIDFDPVTTYGYEKAYVFCEKVYKDFDILSLGVTNQTDTIVYEIEMDPIDIVVGSTSPFPIEKRESDWLAKLLSIIIAVVTIILILIFLPHILKFFGFTAKTVNKTYNSLKANIKSRKRKRKK